MATKQKIKKGSQSFGEVWGMMPVIERVLIFVPLILAVIVFVWVFTTVGSNGGSSAKANRELLLITDGTWQTFETYGIDVWMPKGIPLETVSEEDASYEKLAVQRDKGKFPEIAFGVIVAPDVDGRTFDFSNDPAGVLDVTTPLLTEAVGNMMNGAYPTLTTDLSQITLTNGQIALEGTGEAQVTLVYQDPKDAANQWSEDTTTNLYYNVVLFHGRPIIVWGTWDYSTYEGQKRTVESVADAVVSIMRSDGADVLEPEPDNHNTQSAVTYSQQYDENVPESCYWDEERQQWIGEETGEVHDELPPADDPYWDDKMAGDTPDDIQSGDGDIGNAIDPRWSEIPSPTEQPDDN